MLRAALDLQEARCPAAYATAVAQHVKGVDVVGPAIGGDGAAVGYCACCSRLSTFDVASVQHDSRPDWEAVNWREDLLCRGCHLNSRVRFSLAVLRAVAAPSASTALYVTEQCSYAYAWLRTRFAKPVGSEFATGEQQQLRLQQALTALTGSPQERLRIEDVTRLSFADGQFDVVLSFDVLEHVPRYRDALGEMRRVLRPGGTLLFTVPFVDSAAVTLVRARTRPDGSIEHLLEPEYHGDPVDEAGCLCFYHFGWDLLDELDAAGFSSARVLVGGSVALGHVGPLNVLHATA